MILQSKPLPTDGIGSLTDQVLLLVQTLLILAGVLALAYFVLRFVLPRFAGISGKSGGPIEVIAQHTIAPRKALYIVRVEDRELLLGVWDNGINLLATLKGDEGGSGVEETPAFKNLISKGKLGS